jgi:hypothetical protein
VNVGGLSSQNLLTGLGPEIECEALLVAVVGHVPEGFFRVIPSCERRDGATRVTRARPLDLDHLGAGIGE